MYEGGYSSAGMYQQQQTPMMQNGVAPPMAQPMVQPVAQPVVQPVVQTVVQPVVQPVAQPVVYPNPYCPRCHGSGRCGLSGYACSCVGGDPNLHTSEKVGLGLAITGGVLGLLGALGGGRHHHHGHGHW